MKNPNSVFNGKAHVIKQRGSDSEVIICFSTKFEVSADLKPSSHCAGVATEHPGAWQPVYRDVPGHIS